MGYAFTELVPAAILLDHPGVTMDEFAKLLGETRASHQEYSSDDPWDSHIQEGRYREYSNGLESVAQTLRLRYSPEYKKFQSLRPDGKGLWLDPPWMYIGPRTFSGKGKTYFQVRTHDKNRLGKPIVVKGVGFNDTGFHRDIEHDGGQLPAGIITRVVRKKYVENSSWSGQQDSTGKFLWKHIYLDHFYTYKVEVVPVTEVRKTHSYPSAEVLYRQWPQFRTENKYDFSQPNGHFHVLLSDDKFRWFQRNGNYYLDPATFDQIPASFRDRRNGYGFGYTDLILTAEAIRERAWKLTSYRGLKHAEAFLADFPLARPRFEQAVWDSHSSLSAKYQRMTNTEFLRSRLGPFNF